MQNIIHLYYYLYYFRQNSKYKFAFYRSISEAIDWFGRKDFKGPPASQGAMSFQQS